MADLNFRQAEQSQTRVRRCPYCVEGGEFKAMSANDDGDWLICARCGHLAVVGDPGFKCTCPKCVGLKW
jgi:hypothetical protein